MPMVPDLTLARALRPWTSRAVDLIGRRIADARSHAQAGSLPAAHDRLQELRAALLGNRRDDPKGLLRDARAAFYRQAHDRPDLDPEIHRTELGPSADGEAFIRTTPLFAHLEWITLENLLQEARSHLATATHAAGSPSVSPEFGAAILTGWEARHRERLTSFAVGALSDSQVALHNIVEHALVKPELRDA